MYKSAQKMKNIEEIHRIIQFILKAAQSKHKFLDVKHKKYVKLYLNYPPLTLNIKAILRALGFNCM